MLCVARLRDTRQGVVAALQGVVAVLPGTRQGVVYTTKQQPHMTEAIL
jgi:hypothetical protein